MQSRPKNDRVELIQHLTQYEIAMQSRKKRSDILNLIDSGTLKRVTVCFDMSLFRNRQSEKSDAKSRK